MPKTPAHRLFAKWLAVLAIFAFLTGCNVSEDPGGPSFANSSEQDTSEDASDIDADDSNDDEGDTGLNSGNDTDDPGEDDAGDDDANDTAHSCDDQELNGDETDVDCGGPDCPACDDDKTCIDDADCLSGVCAAGLAEDVESGSTCQAASCNDEVLNGDETDVDCGGSDCPACDTEGLACDGNNDCGTNLSCGDDNLCTCDDERSTETICGAENAQCSTVTDVCGNDVECGPCSNNLVCLESEQSCVQCLSIADCDDAVSCTNNQCISCESDDDCTDDQTCCNSGDPASYCKPDNGTLCLAPL